jgi:hypothetical protein
MRDKPAKAKMGWEDFLSGVLMSGLLAAGVLLVTGGAGTTHAGSLIEAARPAAAESASSAPDRISPGEEIADRDTLDLQLD